MDLDSTLDDKQAGVKRGLVIEFSPEHYEEANELINASRKAGNDVGLIVLNAFRK